MRKLKCYGLDLDGVNFEFIIGFRTWLEKNYNVPFDTSKYVDTFWHTPDMPISEEDFMLAFHKFGMEGGYRNPPLIEGGRDTVNAINAQGHMIVYITNRPTYATEDTIHSLQINGFPQAGNLHFTDGHKSPLVNTFGADVFVDDSPHVIRDLCANTKSKVYCMDYFYNRRLCDTLNFIRIKDWKQFREMENL